MVNVPYRKGKDASSHWPPSPDFNSDWHNDSSLRDELTSKAKAESDRIDKELAAEKARLSKPTVRILLLGQSESGKSTTLRNFQLALAPKAFAADSEAWRTVIHLNLVISVNYLLNILQSVFHAQQQQEATHRGIMSSPPPIHPSEYSVGEKGRFRLHADARSLSAASASAEEAGGSSAAFEAAETPLLPRCSIEVRRLMLTLKPLRSVEATLRQRLGAEAPNERPRLDQEAVYTRQRRGLIRTAANSNASSDAAQFAPQTSSQASSDGFDSSSRSRRTFGFHRHRASSTATATSASSSSHSLGGGSANLQNQQDAFDTEANELLVAASSSSPISPGSVGDAVDSFVVKLRGGTGWRRRARIRAPSSADASKDMHATTSSRPSFDEITEQEEHELLSARQIIEVFGEDIDRLWRAEEVQAVLAAAEVRLDKKPGFFLDDVLRVTSPDYVPSTNDILRARLSTTGVEEHYLTIESGREAGKEWIIYDVGGYRSQRAAWAPYFDSMNAIIFLAPISAFDDYLAEEPNINRLEDTFHLWTGICASRLLQSVEFMLFLNKFDILCDKLRSGIRFSDFVVNYDDKDGKENDPESVARYLLKTFHEVHKELSPQKRKLRAYLTSVIDSRATSRVVTHVKEQLLLGNLTQAHII